MEAGAKEKGKHKHLTRTAPDRRLGIAGEKNGGKAAGAAKAEGGELNLQEPRTEKRPSLTVGRRGEEPRQISRKWSRGNKMGGAISRRNWSRVEGRN